MRILFLTLRADIGGGPEHLFQLLQHLPSDIEPIVACPREEPYFSRYSALVGAGNLLTVPHRAFRLGALFRLTRAVRARSIDLVHSHGKGAGIYSRLLSLQTGVPAVHTFHGLHVGEYGAVKKALYLLVERILGWFTTSAICVSDGERQLIEAARFIAPEKLRTVVNGVAIPQQRPPIAPPPPLRIISVSRYDHQKYPELVVDIANVLRRLHPQLSFLISVLGDGDQRHRCQELIDGASLGDFVHLPGPTSHPRDAFRNAHVYLSTSRWEGMPLAVLEAMSEGLPVVATDVVGNRDAVRDGKNGLLFPLDEPETAAASLVAMSETSLRTAAGQKAREMVEKHYSVAQMAAKTAAVYDEIARRG